MRHRIRRRPQDVAELNITAFMNLMVILVPFLLITAVFSRMTILDLNLPAASKANNAPQKKELQLEIIIRKNAIELGDRNVGVLKRFAKDDIKGLSAMLKQIKARYPQKMDSSILAEPKTNYDTLVQVMDAVRVTQQVHNGETRQVELFPNISIGDAPIGAQP